MEFFLLCLILEASYYGSWYDAVEKPDEYRLRSYIEDTYFAEDETYWNHD